MMLVVLWIMAVALVVLAAAEVVTANLSRRQFAIMQEREKWMAADRVKVAEMRENLATRTQTDELLRLISEIKTLYEARFAELRRERAAEKGEQT